MYGRWTPPSCDCSTFVGRVLRTLEYGGVYTNSECANGGCTPYFTGAMVQQYDNNQHPYIVPVSEMALRGRQPTSQQAENLHPGDIMIYVSKDGSPSVGCAHTGIIGYSKTSEQNYYLTSYDNSSKTYPLLHCSCGGVKYENKALSYHTGVWGVYRVIENAVRYHANTHWEENTVTVNLISRPNLRSIYWAAEAGNQVYIMSQNNDGTQVQLTYNRRSGDSDNTARIRQNEIQKYLFDNAEALKINYLDGPDRYWVKNGKKVEVDENSTAYNDGSIHMSAYE